MRYTFSISNLSLYMDLYRGFLDWSPYYPGHKFFIYKQKIEFDFLQGFSKSSFCYIGSSEKQQFFSKGKIYEKRDKERIDR